jgi:cytidyltransferase-like protein
MKPIRNKSKVNDIDYSQRVYGLICGRFQPLHYGHFEFIDRALDYVDSLYVGIVNPEIKSTNYSLTAPHRTLKKSNIFSFDERKDMLAKLFERYFPQTNYKAISFNFKRVPEIVSNLPDNLIIIHTIYDSWGIEKKSILDNINRKYHLLWSRTDKITSGGMVRNALKNQLEWEHLVPPTTRISLLNIGIKRIQRRLE